MANNQFVRTLVPGRFKYTQVLVCNIAGVVPTTNDISTGQLAINSADQLLYSSNGSAVYILSELFDFTFLVTNTYLQANYSNTAYIQANFIANTTGNAAVIPVGNNSNRPSPGANGYFRYNTDASSLEAFINGSWVYIDYAGGSNTNIQFNDGNYFNGSNSFNFDKTTNTVFVKNTLNTAILFSGNSSANLFANSILLSYSNSSFVANLSPGLLVIGNSQVNTTVISVGPLVLLNTTSVLLGNSTANLFANSILLSVANSTGIANLQPTQLTIGSSIVNTASVSVGGTGGMVINTTAVMAGGNVVLDMIKLHIGNTTANLLANSRILQIANATQTTNVTADGLIVGTTVVNTAGFFGNGAGLTSLPAAGANTQVQYNDSGVFGGSAGFTFTKTTNNVSVANTLNTKALTLLACSSLTVLPTGNPTINTLSAAQFQANTANAAYREFFVSVGLVSNTPLANATVVGDKVALYVGANSQAACNTFPPGLWAINSLISLEAGCNTAGIGYECDYVNFDAHYGDTDFSGAAHIGIAISAGGNKRNHVALLFSGPGVGGTAAQQLWNRGLAFTNDCIRLTSIEDDSNANVCILLQGASANWGMYQAVSTTKNYFAGPVGFAGQPATGVPISVGANLTIDTVKIFVGNSTANLLANSIIVKVSNATATANLQPTQLVLGPNVFLSTSILSIGNSTANAVCNSTNFSVTSTVNTGAIVAQFNNYSQDNVITKYPEIQFGGMDTVGTAKVGGSIRSIPVNSNWTLGDIQIRVGNNSVTSLSTTFNSNGSVIVGNTTALLSNTAVDGFLYIPSCNGAPTGTPTTYTGTVPMIYDKTNNNFYIYNSGWKKTTTFA